MYTRDMNAVPQELSAEALAALAQYASGPFPLAIIDIANSMGVEVLSDAKYPDAGSGHIEVAGGKYQIIVNKSHPPERKLFTIAHELAHYLMDKDYLDKHGSIDLDGNAADESYRIRERRANAFAAQILMPEAAIVEQWLTSAGVEKLAERFGVSPTAATSRAVAVGLIESE
jgi:Zn-dependent peptidase ImmA (M78 family)